ncbi:MAG: sulfite exporter TauE/SafE family protein [Nanoarchaeota archaeon]|nr:sulfite exporter TauE/SafE family protein [Nanoarchaeota archaeon]MBU1029973.1 sulfite exporter TauE/SafE family protein [Nanoarchaeota archaeon]MBU1849256.1 sulfite exporter TauE/SafE family protein [Nanoarchaeota archaeon]
MEPTIIILILAVAIVMELIDAGLGMGYGTVLSPLLIGVGYSPIVVVPAVLFSQAIGGFTAAMFHHKQKNVDFKPKTTNIQKIIKSIKTNGLVYSFNKGFSKDTKIVFAITILGVLATIFGAVVAINIPKWLLTTYIGILVIVIGLIMIFRKKFVFSWKKMVGVGILASFNKGLSGGGFGPVTTGGQIIAGHKHKNAIGCTTLSEAPICIASFLTYAIVKGIATYDLLIILSVGALIGAPFGAMLTKKLNTKRLKLILGIIIVLLGLWTIINMLI